MKAGDDKNPGTKALPLKTIMKGIANANAIRQGFGAPNAKIEVFIAQGTYNTEKVTLTEGISLIGGHQCDSTSNCTWASDPTKFESIIEAVDYEGTLAGHTITRSTLLEKLTLEGKDGSPPGGSFGSTAVMLDGGSPTISNCKLDAPDASGGWPQGRSAAIFIAWTSDALGPLIMANTIAGGKSEWAHGILMANRPGQTKVSNAEIQNNAIVGGTGNAGSAAFRSRTRARTPRSWATT